MELAQTENEKELERLLLSLKDAKNETGTGIWNIGRLLKIIKDRSLYRIKATFWREFCDKVIDIPVRTADRFIRISSTYDLPSVARWGVKKLDILLPLDEEERKTVMKTYEPERISARKLEEEISPLKKQTKDSVMEDNSDMRYFSDLIFLGREILNDISKIKVKLEEFNNRNDGCKFRESYKDYKNKEDIIRLRQQIIKEGGGLV